jgi:hypothetical protein
MKNFNLVILLVLSVMTIACNKDNDETPRPKTKMEIMTAKTWMYDEYFRGYNTSNTVVYYKRGKTNNLVNYDSNRVTFKPDGTVVEIMSNGNTITGTWKFLNNETPYEVTNSLGTWTTTIMELAEGKLNWLVPNVDNGTYGKMIHAQ